MSAAVVSGESTHRPARAGALQAGGGEQTAQGQTGRPLGTTAAGEVQSQTDAIVRQSQCPCQTGPQAAWPQEGSRRGAASNASGDRRAPGGSAAGGRVRQAI